MNRYLIILAGLAIYVTSFFLSCLRGVGVFKGYFCALHTLTLPWEHDGLNLLHHQPFMYFSILLSGWINPLFVIVTVLIVVLILLKKRSRLIPILTAVLVLMMPFCWFIFVNEHLTPREGYYLWTLGMLLVVFADRLSGTRDAAVNS